MQDKLNKADVKQLCNSQHFGVSSTKVLNKLDKQYPNQDRNDAYRYKYPLHVVCKAIATLLSCFLLFIFY